MSKQKTAKVPQIRFKGFVAGWKEELLGNIYTKIRNAFVGTATPYYTDKGHFYLQSNNVKNGEINRNTEVFINEDFYQSQKDKWLRANDIVMVQSGHVGHCAVVPEELDNTAAHALIIISNPSRNVYSYFINFYFQGNRARRDIANITTGNTVKHILASDIKRFPVFFTHRDEQTKIGKYFRELDSLIGLHQRKHDKLVTLKKAMLQKMFPQPGATTPEIRFKGFSETWVEKRLDEICEIVGGGTPSTLKQEYWGGDIDWYSPTEIGDEVYASGSVKKITLLGLSKCSARLLPPDKTVLFTSRAGIGDMAILTKEGCTNQGFQSMVLNDETDPYFIYSMGHLIKIHALKHASGSTFLEISSKQLGKMKILLPMEDEQQKIGTYFRTLDALISQHAIQLQKLQQIKSACLERMFV